MMKATGTGAEGKVQRRADAVGLYVPFVSCFGRKREGRVCM